MDSVIPVKKDETSTDLEQTLARWNDTGAVYPSNTCVHQFFEAWADRTPHSIAVVCGSRRLSYAGLNDKANRLAHHLKSFGVGQGSLVGICLQRSLDLIVAILGTLKAGGAYVPLDPSYPKKRLAAMMGDIDLQLVLTHEEVRPALPETSARQIFVDSSWSRIEQENGANPPGVSPDGNLCYVVFTSGSTGKPKAAGVYHRGWTNLMAWFTREFRIASTDRVLVISSFSFDITQRSIVMPLISGAELHLLDSSHFDKDLILRTVSGSGISVTNCAPSTFYPLVESSKRAYSQLESLRLLFLGGEAISASRIRDWARSPGCKADIVNVYGAAECSDVSSFYILKDFDRYLASSVPIGKPISNTQVFLLGEDSRPVEHGSPGEICVAGDGVGPGYINDPVLTRDKFIANPFNGGQGKFYRTGDLGRMASDLNLEFVGRVDHQVKLRGIRIELGEIESLLRQHSEVKEAVVLSKSFGEQDERLLAYVVPRHRGGSRDQTGSQLRSFLKERLPQHMVPSDVVMLEEMPLSPNGKTDRGALLELDIRTLGIKGGSEEPGSAVESELADIFSGVLKLERVGILDNFFDLGGHSYLVTETLGRVADKLHVDLSIFDFLANPTVADLSRRIEEVRQQDSVLDV